jgi:hypothetical protein
MVFNLTHSQLILRYKENGGRMAVVIMGEPFKGLAGTAVSPMLYRIVRN